MPQNIGQIIGQYQSALDAEQVSTTRLLLADYSMALPRLKAMQTEIIEKIEEDKAAGKKVSKAAILRRTDFQRMTKEVELEMERLAGVLQGAIGGGQPAMAQAGVDMAERLVTEVLSPLPDAAQASIMATFNRMPREAVEALSGALRGPGSPLSDLLASFGEQSAAGIQQAMLANLISGRNPRTMAREMNKAWGVPLTRAMTIARTEQLRAYRHGTAGSYRANAHIVKSWKWHAHLGDRTCMGCLALHGTEFPIEETLDDHANGRCLCQAEEVWTARGKVEIRHVREGDYVLTHRGRYRQVTGVHSRPYNGAILELRQGRSHVRVTPDHRILTNQGWLEASAVSASTTLRTLYSPLVRVSSLKMDHPRAERRASFRASFGALLADLCQQGSSSTASMDSGNAKSMLYRSTAISGIGWSPTAKKRPRNIFSRGDMILAAFVSRYWARPHTALSDPAALCRRLINSGSRAMWRLVASLGEIGAMLYLAIQRMRVRTLIWTSAHSSRYVAPSATYLWASQSATGIPSPSATWASRYGFTMAVPPNDLAPIIQRPVCVVKRLMYNGRVYDLEVEEDHSFVAGGVVCHNCAMVPVTPSWAELGLEGLPETRLPLEAGDGERWFTAQPEAVQLDMMGPGKLNAWKAGQYEFSHLAKETYDARWGRAFVERPLQELVGEGAVTSVPVAQEPERVPKFDSWQEAEKWAQERGIARNVYFRNFDPEVARESTQAVIDAEFRNPWIKDTLGSFGNNRQMNAVIREQARPKVEAQAKKWSQQYAAIWGKPPPAAEVKKLVAKLLRDQQLRMPKNAMAMAYGDSFFISEPIAKDAAKWRALLRHSVDVGWHPMGTQEIRSVVDHELMHIVDAKVKVSRDARILDILRDARFRGEMPSDYAKKDIGEFVAESWAEYINSPKPRRVAQAVGDRVEELLREVQE